MAKSSKKAAVAADAAPAPNVHPLRRGIGDTLVNLVTGMGTAKDKGTATTFGFSSMDRAQLEAAYRGDWVSRKVIDIPAYDATREWRSWETDVKDLSAIEDLEMKLGVQRKTMATLQRARLYGGAAMVLGIDQGKPEDPIDLEKLGKDCLKFVHVVNRHEITAGQIEWDITSEWFGQPSYYERSVQGGRTLPVKLHPSRVVRFIGAEIPDLNQSQGWGDSTLQIVADAVISMGTVAASMASLIQEAKVDIVKIPELSERISNTEYENKLKTRFALAALMKSIYSVLLIDKEEEWTRVNQTFAGMPEVLQEFMILVCGSADIPATRFLGQAPKGMNATGNSDTRNYYDRVATEQKVVLQPTLKMLDDVLLISALGKKPDGIFYNWNALWQMDETQRADNAVKLANVMTADVNAALLDPLVLQKARENQLIEEGTYPGLEQIIEEHGTDINTRAPDPNADPNAAALAAHVAAGGDPAKFKPPVPPGATPPKPGQPPAPANNNAAPPKKKAAATGDEEAVFEAMTARIRDADLVDASTPRTLYIYRPVLNWRDIARHYKGLNVNNVEGSDMHVTICYSKTPVDWLKVGEDRWGSDEEGNIHVRAGGPRVMEQFNTSLVLAFSNSDLQYRHCSILERTGGTWDYEDYTPHVTISNDAGAVDPLTMPAYVGEIVLGPEVFQEIRPSYWENPAKDSAPAPAPAPIVIPAPVVNVTVARDSGKVTRSETSVVKHDARGRVIGFDKTITETPTED